LKSGKSLWAKGAAASLALKAKMCFIDKLIAGIAAIKIVAFTSSLAATITNSFWQAECKNLHKKKICKKFCEKGKQK